MKFEVTYDKGKNVYDFALDDGRSTTVHAKALDRMELWTKDEIDEETFTELLKTEAEIVLEKKAFSLLERRAYSRREFFDKLYKYESDKEIRNRLLEKLEDLGLIDDEEYARQCACHYMETKHSSLREAKNKMIYDKKLSSDIVETALEEYEDSEYDNMIYIIEKNYLRKIESARDWRDVQKVIAAVARKGFPLSEVIEAVKEYAEEYEEE